MRLRETLEAGMFLVGTCYNFCWVHNSLRKEGPEGDQLGGKWVESNPRPGGGAHESPLVGREVVELFGATGRDTQVAQAATKMAGGGSACSLTML